MSSSTDQTIIKTYPPPEEESKEQPHTKLVYAKPVKHRTKYGLWTTCYETGNIKFWIPLEQLIDDEEIHDYFYINHRKYSTFSKYWRLTTKQRIKFKVNDVVYDDETNTINVITSIINPSLNFIHPVHRHRISSIFGKQVDIKRSIDKGRIIQINPLKKIDQINSHKIGSKAHNKTIFKIIKKGFYINSKNFFINVIKNKLSPIINPTKHPTPFKKLSPMMRSVYDDYLVHVLVNRRSLYTKKGYRICIKLRTGDFNQLWKSQEGSYIEKTVDEREVKCYLDYIVITINLYTNRSSFVGIYLKQNTVTGNILGEDYIPSDW